MFLIIVGNKFYHILYGIKYEFNLLNVVILSVGVIFNCTGMIAGQLSVINKSFWLPISRSILGLIVSITCRLTLLPFFSIRGAVIGFLITSFITNLLAYSFFKSGRRIFSIQTKSIFR
jgi:O-antigen/teichoic acid export membrane protein